MAGFAQNLSRTVLVLFAWLWAWVMVVGGVLAMTELTGRFPVLAPFRYPVFIFGAVLAASGVFVFALVLASRLPKANAWITGLFMTMPWLVLAVVLLGGLE